MEPGESFEFRDGRHGGGNGNGQKRGKGKRRAYMNTIVERPWSEVSEQEMKSFTRTSQLDLEAGGLSHPSSQYEHEGTSCVLGMYEYFDLDEMMRQCDIGTRGWGFAPTRGSGSSDVSITLPHPAHISHLRPANNDSIEFIPPALRISPMASREDVTNAPSTPPQTPHASDSRTALAPAINSTYQPSRDPAVRMAHCKRCGGVHPIHIEIYEVMHSALSWSLLRRCLVGGPIGMGIVLSPWGDKLISW